MSDASDAGGVRNDRPTSTVTRKKWGSPANEGESSISSYIENEATETSFISLGRADDPLNDRVHRYQLDVEVAEHTEQSMKYLLIRDNSDEMRQSPIKIGGLKTLKSVDKPRAQSAAHDDLVRITGHSSIPSLVSVDSHEPGHVWPARRSS